MHLRDVDTLDATRTYWVPAVVAPARDWGGMPTCRKGARFMVDRRTLQPSRDAFEAFDSKASCLQWIMRHRAELNRNMSGAQVHAVALDEWILGLA